MKYRDKNVTIGEVVVELPKASGVLKEFGIDFCCGGYRNLSKVVKEQGIDSEKLYQQLDELYEQRKSLYQLGGNPEQMSEDTHHTYMRQTLPEISELLSVLLRVHGRNHSELFEVYKVFTQLKGELEQHLLKEETMLFPDLKEKEEYEPAFFELAQSIITEHEAAGRLLEELRRLTKNYTVPNDACQTYERTYHLLEEMEGDLHQHIHLENNILLKDYVKHENA